MVGLKKQKINNKKPNEFLCWTFCIHGYKIRPYILRAWYNGSTSASQAEDEGSIPFARTKKINRRNRRFCFWIVGDGIEPDKAASAAQGSERSGVFSPHAVKGARRNHQISAGNYTFPSPAPPFASARLRVAAPHVRRAAQAKECHTKS